MSYSAASLALWILLLFVYFVPTMVAVSRGHHSTAAIGILNILLGWTLIGWIAALVWASTDIKKPTVDEDAAASRTRRDGAILAAICIGAIVLVAIVI